MISKELSGYYYNKGIELFKNNKVTDAIQAFNNSVVIDENIKILNLMGLCYYRLGQFEKSLYYWNKSIEVNDSDDNDAFDYIQDLVSEDFLKICEEFNKSLLLCKENKYKKALKILSNIKAHEFVKIANLCGLCNFALNKKEEALYIWKQSLKIDSSNEVTLSYIAQEWDSDKDIGSVFKKAGEALSKFFN